jgi:hypothetical protein
VPDDLGIQIARTQPYSRAGFPEKRKSSEARGELSWQRSSSYCTKEIFMKKTISTKVHGMIDYPAGLLLLLAPNLFGFADVGGAAVGVPRLIGIIVLAQSIFTRYELGLVKAVPMQMHLMFDYFAGAVLAASPWLFGFYDSANQRMWVPHLVVGLIVLLVTSLTEKEPRHIPGHDTDHRQAANA